MQSSFWLIVLKGAAASAVKVNIREKAFILVKNKITTVAFPEELLIPHLFLFNFFFFNGQIRRPWSPFYEAIKKDGGRSDLS